MPARPLLYYITDRTQFPGPESGRTERLLQKIQEAAAAAVDFIQLREKDLSTRDLEKVAREAVAIVRSNARSGQCSTRILLNSRTDIALAAEADGVHLRSDDISPADARNIWHYTRRESDRPRPQPFISVSCHTAETVLSAQQNGADLAVFAPVFEKKDAPNTRLAGVEMLRAACQHKIPVLALGGVTLDNAAACLQAGAAGIAGIRLFQQNEMSNIVTALGRLVAR
jgi:thiamine-phosphate pyrophosphorylase